MKYFDIKKYNVEITDVAMKKLNTYIEICPVEISGIGTVKPIQYYNGKNNINYLIDDIILLKQSCFSTYTELDQSKIIEFMTDQLNLGNLELVDSLKLWWHSHVKMDTFWSGVDRGTIDQFNSDSVFISIVGNKFGKKRVSVDYYNPRVCMDDVDLKVIKTGTDLSKIEEECKKEFKEKVLLNDISLNRKIRGN